MTDCIRTTINYLRERSDIIRWIVAACAVILSVYFLVENRNAFLRLRQLSLGQLLLLICAAFAFLMLRAYRRLVILKTLEGLDVGYWQWFKVFTLGCIANKLFTQAGTVYRATVLQKRHGIPYSGYINAFAFFTWFDLLLTLCITFVLLVIFRPALKFGWGNPAIYVGGGVIVLVLLPFIMGKLLSVIQPTSPVFRWVHEKLKRVVVGMQEESSNKRLLAQLTCLGGVLFTIHVVEIYIAFQMINLNPGWVNIAVFVAAFKVITSFPIVPGNLGLREMLYGILSTAGGFGIAEGILVSVLSRAVKYLVLFPTGMACGGLQFFRKSEPQDSAGAEMKTGGSCLSDEEAKTKVTTEDRNGI